LIIQGQKGLRGSGATLEQSIKATESGTPAFHKDHSGRLDLARESGPQFAASYLAQLKGKPEWSCLLVTRIPNLQVFLSSAEMLRWQRSAGYGVGVVVSQLRRGLR